VLGNADKDGGYGPARTIFGTIMSFLR